MENFTKILKILSRGSTTRVPFFFLFWVVCVALLFPEIDEAGKNETFVCKIHFGSPPSQKKNRESDQPLLEVDQNAFFFTCLSTFSLSRSRPHQSLSSPQSTLLLQSQSPPPAASSVSSPPFHFFGGSICICQLSIGSR